MHIAICDDNIADRKQLERLLKRESDKRASKTGILYADSFGNKEALLNNPMQYDVFYIDVCHTNNESSLMIVEQLRNAGVKAPIIMCCSDIDYRQQDFPPDTLFLDKPIKTAELSESIDMALDIKNRAPSLIELRTDTETYYVTEAEVMYGTEEGRFVIITLTDGRKINVVSDIFNFYGQIRNNPCFILTSQKVIINGRHISTIKYQRATMSDGKRFVINRRLLKYTQMIMRTFK